MSKNVSRAELDFQLKMLHGSRKVELDNEIQNRESARVQRHMDKEIKSTRAELEDIVATTSNKLPKHRRMSIPEILVSKHRPPAAAGNERYSHYQEQPDNLKIKTKHNLQLSEKLSENIRKREERRRERSSSPGRFGRPLTPKSVEDLYVAANVLRDTEHGAEAKKLLDTVLNRHKHN